jgi:iron complex outermembrane receptor protein
MMTRSKYLKTNFFIFSRWTRKGFSILISLKQIIKIAFLPFIYTILHAPVTVVGQADTIRFDQKVDLDEIEVIGQLDRVTLRENARFVNVIDHEEISIKPATSYHDILEYAPGVDLRQRNENGVQADVSIRGGTFDQVMVLLNGINVTDAQTGHHSLNLPVDVGDIERVEILHGPGARLFGADAFSGAINFVTNPNPEELFRAKLTTGQHGFFKANAAGNFAFDKVENFLSGTYSTSSGYDENTDFDIINLFYHGQTNINNSTTDLQLGYHGKGFGANSFYSPKFPKQYEETTTAFASITHESGIKFPFQIRAYWRRHFDRFLLDRDNPSFYENYHRTDLYGVNTNISYSGRFGTSTIGMNFKTDEILSTVLGNEISPQVLIRGTDTTFYTKGAETYHYHFFAEQSFSIDKFYFAAGLMAGSNTFLDYKIRFYPGMDIAYWLTKNFKLSASIQKTLRTPTYTELYYMDPTNRGNENLKPEEAIGLDAGVKMFHGNWNWHLFYYHQTGDNLIGFIWQPDDSYRLARNIEKVNVNGIETGFDYTPSFSWLQTINIGYAFNSVDKSLTEIPDNLKHKITAGFHHQIIKDLSLYWHARYMHREGSFITYNSADDTYPLIDYEPYWLMNAKLFYTINFLRIFIDVTNVLDKEYYEVTSLKQPGRWFKVGAEVKLMKK